MLRRGRLCLLVVAALAVTAPVVAVALLSVSTGSAAPGFRVFIDADISDGICDNPASPDSSLTVTDPDGFDVAICVEDPPAPPAIFDMSVLYDDTIILAPEVADVGFALDDNPDLNQAALGGGWNCSLSPSDTPRGDDDPATGPGHGRARIACKSDSGPYTFTSTGHIALIHFNTRGISGSTTVALSDLVLGDSNDNELGSCNPALSFSIPCVDGDVTVTGAPTPTITPTPTLTPTPTPCPGGVCPTPTPTSTPMPTNTPSPAFRVFVDADTSDGICDLPPDSSLTVAHPASFDVAVCVEEPQSAVGVFELDLVYDDTIIVAPELADVPPGIDDNPDANQAALGGGWECSGFGFQFPTGDVDAASGPGHGRAVVSCGSLTGPFTFTSTDYLALIHFDTLGVVGSTTFELEDVVLGDRYASELGTCNPTIAISMPCVGAGVTVTLAPTPTPTATATPTETPQVPIVRMEKDASDDPLDIVGEANLWLCEDCPPPGDPGFVQGEGALVISERVFGVGGDPEGAGTYEFQVKYDHKIFDVEVADTSWLSHGGTRDVECEMSVLTENWILWGCVSSDPTPGDGNIPPGQDEDGVAAEIIVLPEADLVSRLTPGQENGLLRTILDENCEVADIFGDPLADAGGTPLPGISPGGQVATCGDITITIRILEGDLNLDCVVDVLDDQMIAFRYGASFGNLLYDPWFDLEPALKDFDVDIKDLQKVFGRNGSTCQGPIPPQPPRLP